MRQFVHIHALTFSVITEPKFNVINAINKSINKHLKTTIYFAGWVDGEISGHGQPCQIHVVNLEQVEPRPTASTLE